MLTNYHTHSTFCDGKNTPEEIILYAIENDLDAIGFSGHGYTPYDLRYCMKDTGGYIAEINRLKEKYKNKIQIYLGVEEDAFSPVNHADFDYIIQSCHYYVVDGTYYPIDSTYDHFKKCLEVFEFDCEKMAESYYGAFCEQIINRRPDVIGHYDLITKFDEIDVMRFLDNPKYLKIAEKYTREIVKNDVIFEVNTGAISRGFRKTPYPQEPLLKIIKENDGKVMLASDSHEVGTLVSYFGEAKKYLKDMGFDCVYVLYDGKWQKDYLK